MQGVLLKNLQLFFLFKYSGIYLKLIQFRHVLANELHFRAMRIISEIYS